MAEQPKPGICECRRIARNPLPGDRCPECGHTADVHIRGAGCLDGIDHPGSVGEPVKSCSQHGPSAEQWARGMALLYDATLSIGRDPSSEARSAVITQAEHYILSGDR